MIYHKAWYHSHDMRFPNISYVMQIVRVISDVVYPTQIYNLTQIIATVYIIIFKYILTNTRL